MILLKTAVPAGALLGDNFPDLSQQIAASGALWYCAQTGFFSKSGKKLSKWNARAGQSAAVPVPPNDGNAALSKGAGARALVLQAEQNCGFRVDQAKPAGERFSGAVIYASPKNDARTLVCINPRAGKNYLFVSERDGTLELQIRSADDRLSFAAPRSGDQFHLLLFSMSGSMLTLALDGQAACRQSFDVSDLKGECDLFIGCRSDRAGIGKTLGDALISDVFFWPGRDLFDVSEPEAAGVRRRLSGYLNGVIRHGV